MSDEEMHLAKSDNDHLDQRFDEVLGELKKMQTGFPRNADGTVDFDGHRRYHESMIEAAKAQTEFWRDLKLEIAKKGVWSLLVIVCGLVTLGLSAKLGFTALK